MEACAIIKPDAVMDILSSVGNNYKSPEYLDRVLLAAGRAKRNFAPHLSCTKQMHPGTLW